MKRFPALAILYYGLAIIFGIILGFYFIAFGESSKITSALTNYAEQSDTYGVTRLLSVYQNPTAILSGELSDGTDYAVYEVDSTYSETVDSTTYYYVEKEYMGIIINPGDSWLRDSYATEDGTTTNKFGLRFDGLTADGTSVSYDYRIGYVDGDASISDDDSTIIQNRYASYTAAKFYFFGVGDQVFDEYKFSSVTSITFVNNDLTDYETVKLSTPWTLQSDFFTFVSTFNTAYNLMVSQSASTSEINEKASQFETEVINAGYTSSNYSEIIKYVPMQNVFKILGYVLIILVLGDFLVGKHHIIHLFQRIFGKNKKVNTNEIPDYMQEYDVNVIFKAIVPNGYNKIITIKYQSDDNKEISFNLKKSESYEENIRVKNGTYSHPEIIAEGLKCLDVPSQINIKGFKYSQEFIFEEIKK